MVGTIAHAAYLRGGWKRKANTMSYTKENSHLFSFVTGNFDEIYTESAHAHVHILRACDGGEIKDPTPKFLDGELELIHEAADEIVQLAKQDMNVLIVCRGGKNRSPFLAQLARKKLRDSTGNVDGDNGEDDICMPWDDYLVRLLMD